MKLLLIITDYGSFNNFLSDLALKLSNLPDFQLHIICSEAKIIDIQDKENFKELLKFHFVDIPRKISLIRELKTAFKIRKIITELQPDLVHIHFTTAAFPALLLKNPSVNYWATFHGLGMNASVGIKKIVFTLVEWMCFIRLNKIFTVNNEDFNLVNKYFASKTKKYECLGFGCDIQKYDSNNLNTLIKQDKIIKYGLNNNHTVIAYTGRFVSFKGFHLVIKMFKQLTSLHPDKFKLILMGGPDSVHPSGLDVDDEFFFTESPDIINIGFTNDVELYLSMSDIFVFPSKKEGLPTCSLEALAMGVPVITFNTRGNNDLIINEYNGILLQPEDNPELEISAILKAVMEITKNKHLYTLLKNNAIKDRLMYSRQRFVEEQLMYYTEFEKNAKK